MNRLVDTHCHLDSKYSHKSAAQLISEARLAGISKLITVATGADNLLAVREISEKNEGVFHTAGIHPHDSSGFLDNHLKLIAEETRHPLCKAIGEIGLDYHYDSSPRDVQKEVFSKQLSVAVAAKKPVIVHSREAEEDTLAILKEYVSKLTKDQIPGVLHCFTSSLQFGLKCLDLGFYISFAGIITFSNATELHECVKKFPLERLLIETDSPFLAPVPFRGKKCEPSMLPSTAKKIAELRQVDLEKVAEQTTLNATQVFNLS